MELGLPRKSVSDFMLSEDDVAKMKRGMLGEQLAEKLETEKVKLKKGKMKMVEPGGRG